MRKVEKSGKLSGKAITESTCDFRTDVKFRGWENTIDGRTKSSKTIWIARVNGISEADPNNPSNLLNSYNCDLGKPTQEDDKLPLERAFEKLLT